MQSPYEQRIWLKQYPSWYPADIELPRISALEAFEQSAAKFPDSPAFHYFDVTLSYGEINGLAERFATALAVLGIEKGDRVIVQLQSIPQFLIAVYGMWKLGCIAVPLNPMYREREMEFYAKDCGVKCVVTMETCFTELAKILPRVGVKHVITTSELDYFTGKERPDILRDSRKQRHEGSLDMLELLEKHKKIDYPRARLTPEDVAYLTYTSGTTGPPKGAMNTHGNVVFAASCVKTAFRLGQGDKTMALAPFIHVTGTVTILASASLAAIPVIACYRFDAGEILRLIEKWEATFAAGPPTAVISLMSHPDFDKRDISSLTRINPGGASLSPAVFQKFEQRTGKLLLNGYGLTETSSPAIVTPYGMRDPVDPQTNAMGIGLPIPSVMARIVDIDSGEDLPVGKEGEVVIKGPNIIPGYWNKPEETAHAIKDGWLFSGDIGKMDEKGWFYIIDRKKDLINASGYKIWPREVEDVLYSHPAVKEACVVGVPDSYRGETVKAFVVLNDASKGKVTPEELIAYSKTRMAAYKYPREIEIIEEIPKTISGKMLRRQMREQELRKRV